MLARRNTLIGCILLLMCSWQGLAQLVLYGIKARIGLGSSQRYLISINPVTGAFEQLYLAKRLHC